MCDKVFLIIYMTIPTFKLLFSIIKNMIHNFIMFFFLNY